MNVCGAKTRGGAPCQKAPKAGSTRCRLHGGASPRGLAHPSTTSGRYSKHLPTRLAAQYEASLSDADLIVMRDEVALLEARLSDLLKRADTGEAGSVWRQICEAADAFKAAAKAGDPQGSLEAAQDMAALATRGRADHATWQDIISTIEQLRKGKEAERRRLEAVSGALTADRVMLLVAALTSAVRHRVDDRKTLDLIGRDFERLIGAGGSGRDGGAAERP